MLKRSFAEFHAQRSQPAKLAALQRGQRLAEAYAARPWPTCYADCSREDVAEYYRVNERIDELTGKIQVLPLSCYACQQGRTAGAGAGLSGAAALSFEVRVTFIF